MPRVISWMSMLATSGQWNQLQVRLSTWTTRCPLHERDTENDQGTYEMNFRGNHWLLIRALGTCKLLFWGFAVFTLQHICAPALAAEYGSAPIVVEGKSRFLSLGIGKSVVVVFPGRIKDVLVPVRKV